MELSKFLLCIANIIILAWASLEVIGTANEKFDKAHVNLRKIKIPKVLMYWIPQYGYHPGRIIPKRYKRNIYLFIFIWTIVAWSISLTLGLTTIFMGLFTEIEILYFLIAMVSFFIVSVLMLIIIHVTLRRRFHEFQLQEDVEKGE